MNIPVVDKLLEFVSKGRIPFPTEAKARRLAKTTQGSVAIEAAIAVPLIIIIISGVMQLAVIGMAYINMQEAARDAAREISVRRVSVSGPGFWSGVGSQTYSNTCDDALNTQPINSPQHIACSRLYPSTREYSVDIVENDGSGSVSDGSIVRQYDAYLRLSIPITELLYFNIGFLGSSATLNAEAKYVVEDAR